MKWFSSFTLVLGTLVLACKPALTMAQAPIFGCSDSATSPTNETRIDATTAIQFWNQTFLMHDGLIYYGSQTQWTCRSNGRNHVRTMQECSQTVLQLWDSVETKLQAQPTKASVSDQCYMETEFVFVEWNKKR
ncbi:MAG: hypothetical protein J3Q66DRAFT_408669 [Benniella sp.]|nr:MAG: hypothetical protein J3Q66DRAFT_408669 [Benniella sp.]